MFRDIALPASATSSGTEEPRVFRPSISAIREHVARQDADRILDQFAERFTEDNYFPEGGDGLLFAMLTLLPQWSVNMGIVVVDSEGGTLVSYLKGNDWTVVEQTITFVQRDDGSYSAPGSALTYLTESLFWVLCSQIPSTSEIGRYGDDISVESRIATLRGQISRASRMERALLFEALMADAHISKSGSTDIKLNPYLPFWTSSPQDWPLALWSLHEVNPQLPVARLEDLLLSLPLTDDQQADLLNNATLPETFFEALQESLHEWSHYRAIDGLRHTRVYDAQTDDLARTLAGGLLKDRLARDLVITEYEESRYQPLGPNDNPVILVQAGKGVYGREDEEGGVIRPVERGTDSFYLAILAQLRAYELHALGLESDQDVNDLRAVIAGLASEGDRGMLYLEGVSNTSEQLLPDWIQQASSEDMLAWKAAMQAYSQAVLEAQAPGFIDVSAYGEPRELRNYVREKLSARLSFDHGLALSPDEIFIVTRHVSTEFSFAVDTEYGFADSSEPVDVIPTAQARDLIELCLENLSITDLNFLLTGQAFDSARRPISQLTPTYLFNLVRDLNVGESYLEFLSTRLLTSPEGQWCKEHYALVMQAQMRIDALEAKMAGDFREGVDWPAGHDDRGYKWVQAVLDHPVDDDARALVDGHRVAVEKIQINRVPLDGLLIIRQASSYFGSPIVVYIPQMPDGRCFWALNRLIDLRSILQDPVNLEHVIDLAAPEYRDKIRDMLVNHWHMLGIETTPFSRSFLEASYKTQVNRVVAAVNQQTSTTSEKNWESAWEIIRFVGETVLAFTPFKVAFPIAALRSLYAITQGVQSTQNGEQEGSLYFVEAALFLLDALGPNPKIKPSKVRSSGFSSLRSSKALAHSPEGLKLRTDGVYSGVYEVKKSGVPTSFYVKDAGKTYPVRYDRDYATWRLIDPRRPDAYYQAPISFEGGVWTHAKVGLLGGGRKAVKAPTPGPSGASGAPKRYTLDVAGFENSKPFKKADPHIQDALRQSVERVTEKYIERGGGKFHGYEEKGTGRYISTFDLTGIPGGKGRGPWRLQVIERVVLDENGQVVKVPGQPGVLEFDKLLPSH
ncbi:hypothetical protein AUC61_02185 [Pseudomonas sp. S25]|uniref:Dermonecrotic toxin N-terminal domain-containing protein n=1 Tax=Pseudomonas maioricensis TaxID=1766623 RepID=A0ABS9ZD80_9PSED|nr:DUF6543 domain-containing protein [Pseudomonas sp. S25]MCI8208332.1 hypothetical protein [Pseudomonas sp. S25]